MSVIGSNILAGASGQAVGYQVQRSLRFNSADSAYLSRTPASAGNRRTWTFSAWVKRAMVPATIDNMIFSATGYSGIRIESGGTVDSLLIFDFAGSFNYRLATTQVFRDPCAWYHLVFALDTTQATASNRLKLYINGSEVTQFSATTYPAQNYDGFVNAATVHNIGRNPDATSQKFDGYLADVHFIDGQALTPSSFTEVSATTGQLLPRQYTGSFGANGFWLKFSDNSNNTATTLGKDYSPNGNNWTPNNLSVTAGAGNDSLVDTPTSYGTDTGAGGEVRGNYCTLNPLDKASNFTLSNGNLDGSYTSGGSVSNARGTFAYPASGKWYYEYVPGGSYLGSPGIAASNVPYTAVSSGNLVAYREDGQKNVNATVSSYGASYVAGDVIGVAYDADSNSVTFYKNGVSQGAITPTASLTYFPFVSLFNSTCVVNFGQRPWAYTPPANHRPLVDTCLPAPVVAKASTVMDVIRYTGTGANATIPNVNTVPTSIDFAPDLVWIKMRSAGEWHILTDSVRGDNKSLFTNRTDSEYTAQGVSLTSNGFSLDSWTGTNTSSGTYVAWCWDAGTSTVSNTQGSITSSVRANPTAGFSVVTYPSGSTNATVGHGLGVAPGLIIAKSRTTTANWVVYHSSLGKDGYLHLDLTNAFASGATNYWGTAGPNSTTFGLATSGFSNNTGNMVAYCFAPVAGYSAFGSYTGNGSTDGPFVYTGFRPRWVMVKLSSTAGENWVIMDAARSDANLADDILWANLSNAELGNYGSGFDFTSNGFKIRGTWGGNNTSGATYVWAAFAESPFQYARAR